MCKKEAIKLAKTTRIFEKITYKIWTFKALNGPIFGRIKIQTCQIPCNLADLSAGFGFFFRKNGLTHAKSEGLQQNFSRIFFSRSPHTPNRQSRHSHRGGCPTYWGPKHKEFEYATGQRSCNRCQPSDRGSKETYAPHRDNRCLWTAGYLVL